MISIQAADVRAADRIVEALYVAAGQHPHTQRAAEWLELANQLEASIDQLPPTYPPRERHLHPVGQPAHDRAS